MEIRETAELVLITIKKKCENCKFYSQLTIKHEGCIYTLDNKPRCVMKREEFKMCNNYQFSGIEIKNSKFKTRLVKQNETN